MKPLILALCGGAALMLSACADDYYGPRHLHGRPGYSVYYDDFYGPVRDGRWGSDGYYYYRGANRDDYVRDEGRHFRRDAYDGYHGMTFGASADVGVRGPAVGIGVRP